eukprot:scaffold663_cov341-Pavlova_lutheri.AAC.13
MDEPTKDFTGYRNMVQGPFVLYGTVRNMPGIFLGERTRTDERSVVVVLTHQPRRSTPVRGVVTLDDLQNPQEPPRGSNYVGAREVKPGAQGADSASHRKH